jgi:HD-GYP domain-containing protein (c-di-GMP phosphodiesterase class II)
MAVADAYSAMTTDRPYRKGMCKEKALSILKDGMGTQWDAACVEVFLRAQNSPAGGDSRQKENIQNGSERLVLLKTVSGRN